MCNHEHVTNGVMDTVLNELTVLRLLEGVF